MDPRTRRSLYGIPTFDWTRGRLGARRSTVLVMWPDPFDFQVFETTRLLRRIAETKREDQVALLLIRRPEKAREYWNEANLAHAWFTWFERLREEKPFGILAEVRRQSDLFHLQKLLEEGFPAKQLVLQLAPEEPLTIAPLQPDHARLGARSGEHLRSTPLPEEWVRSLSEQCPNFQFMSWGGWVPIEKAPPGQWKTRGPFAHIGSRNVAPEIDGQILDRAPQWWSSAVPGPSPV